MNDGRRLRVLFVDDEERVLQGLQRMLRPLRDEWEMGFAGSGEQALRELAAAPFDVVVSDMRMPGMNGAELLAEVMRRYPGTVRLILSGQADEELVRKTVGPTHQYLSKPCDAATLKATIAHAARLRALLADQRLRALVGGMEMLPSMPSLYLDLVALVKSPRATLKDIGELIASDLGMSAKVLQLVNSSFFGVRRQVASPADAVAMLGIETVQALTLSVHTFATFAEADIPGFSLSSLWSHSMKVAALAKRIALAERADKALGDTAFMAGMLHDAGRLALAANLPDEYRRALAAGDRPVHELEQAVFGASHAEVGAYLLGLWGIADPIIEAIAFHHRPSTAHAAFSALTAVHVANGLQHALDGGAATGALDAAYLLACGCAERVPVWCELVRGSPNPEVPHG